MISLVEFLLLSLAAYRITRLLIEDTIFSGVRERIWRRFPPESTKAGYLFTCYWCLGFWVSLLIGVLYILFPAVMILVALVLAISAVVGIIDTLLNR